MFSLVFFNLILAELVHVYCFILFLPIEHVRSFICFVFFYVHVLFHSNPIDFDMFVIIFEHFIYIDICKNRYQKLEKKEKEGKLKSFQFEFILREFFFFVLFLVDICFISFLNVHVWSIKNMQASQAFFVRRPVHFQFSLCVDLLNENGKAVLCFLFC